MSILAINASPRKDGNVAGLVRAAAQGAGEKHQVDYIDLYDCRIAHCVGCMKCRPDGECVLPDDDGQRLGRLIDQAEGLIIGTPTHWSNMSAPLKDLFDRNVPRFIGQKNNGLPLPRHPGKPALILTACTTPWPFHNLAGQSRGAVKAVAKVLKSGGFKVTGRLAKPGDQKGKTAVHQGRGPGPGPGPQTLC